MSIYLGDTPLADGASTALLAGKADVDLSNSSVPHIQRLKDESPIPEGEIAELVAEREAKVAEIKERYPYSGDEK